MTNLDSTLKSTLSTNIHLVKAMVFPVVLYGCESWTIKKAEHQRIYAFELWCWKRLLRVPWTARISNQSILKELSPGCSLVGLLLKLKLQYFGHLKRKADSFEKTLMLGKTEGRGEGDDRGWDSWMASPTRWTWVWVDSGNWWWTGRPGMLWFMGSKRVGHDWATELNWTETTTVHPKWCRSWVSQLALKVSESKHFKLYRVHSISANSLGSNMFVYNPSAVSKSFLFHQLLQKPMTISHSLLTLYVENHWVMRILKTSQTCSEYLSPPLFSIHFLFRSSLYSQHGTRLKGIEELRLRLIQITATLAHFFEGQQKQTWEKMFSTFPQKVKMLNYQIKNLSLIN